MSLVASAFLKTNIHNMPMNVMRKLNGVFISDAKYITLKKNLRC